MWDVISQIYNKYQIYAFIPAIALTIVKVTVSKLHLLPINERARFMNKLINYSIGLCFLIPLLAFLSGIYDNNVRSSSKLNDRQVQELPQTKPSTNKINSVNENLSVGKQVEPEKIVKPLPDLSNYKSLDLVSQISPFKRSAGRNFYKVRGEEYDKVYGLGDNGVFWNLERKVDYIEFYSGCRDDASFGGRIAVVCDGVEKERTPKLEKMDGVRQFRVDVTGTKILWLQPIDDYAVVLNPVLKYKGEIIVEDKKIRGEALDSNGYALLSNPKSYSTNGAEIEEMPISGVKYYPTLKIWGEAYLYLNKQFSQLVFWTGCPDRWYKSGKVRLIGDGREILITKQFSSSDSLVKYVVDVSGINTVQITPMQGDAIVVNPRAR